MDILDVMLAKAMTPQGKTDAYVSKANRAAQRAAQAAEDAATAVATVEGAADEIATAREEAAALLEEAQEVLETAQGAQINLPEAYNGTGQNTDGYMTQKATTDALALKADKSYVDNAIAQGGGSGSGVSISFSQEEAGYITKVSDEGNLVTSTISEDDLIEMLVRAGSYTARDAVGLDVDYSNRTFARTQLAIETNFNFNSLSMYGGRKRCNVNDAGEILAFEGEQGYATDGSNGQVMIYQPKFYYKRVPLSVDDTQFGIVVRHEQIIISATKQPGFKLAPIFEGELEYVLLPAFEGSIVDNKLASVSGRAPVTNINISDVEAAATARGNGWHILTLAAEATNQMLEIVEWGSMNGQVSFGYGFANEASMHETGANGALTYRGMENPWGNRWRMIGGVNLFGDGAHRGGEVYICTDYNYTPDTIGQNYVSAGFCLPSTFGWINAMGYSNRYDWIYLPIECSDAANSLVPVGDNLWTTANTTVNKILAIGGNYNTLEHTGPFYYAADRSANESARSNYGASLMFIPTKNQIYETNLSKWTTLMGG